MSIPNISFPERSFLDAETIATSAIKTNDIAVFGAPHGSPYAGLGDVAYDVETFSADAPNAIRIGANESSTSLDHFDFDLGGPILADNKYRLVDCGDLELSETDGFANRLAIQTTTSTILAKGGTPILLGGDDSVPVPFLRAYENLGPVDILQIDAHIDWRDAIDGERDGYSSTMVRASENKFVRSITQVGMRGVGSARQVEVDTALDWGARLLTVREARKLGNAGIIDQIPTGGNLIIQIDCDAFDTSVCPAVNAPTPGGFQFDEIADLVQMGIAKRGLAGFSIVELVPILDPNKISAIVAARIICNAIGALARV